MLRSLLTRAEPLPPDTGGLPPWWPGYSGMSWGTEGASEQAARGLPPLTGAIQLITGTVLQMPLRCYRLQPGGRWLADDPQPTVIRNPAAGPNRTVADFDGEYLLDSILFGNYVALLGPPDATGWPTGLIPLPVDQVGIARGADGWPVYRFHQDIYDASQVFHVAHDVRTGELAGRGVLRRFREELAASWSAERWTASYFNEGAIPPGVILDSRPDLTQDQADLLKAKWRAMVTRREPMVLPKATTEFVPLVSDADKAQAVQAREWNASLVAMMLNIPPFLLGLPGPRMTYSNAETVFEVFVKTAVRRLTVPLAQQLTLQCVPAGHEVRFDVGGITQPDVKTRFETYQIGLASGFLTVDEVRAAEGMPPMGGTP